MPTGEALPAETPAPEPPPTPTATASSSPASAHRHRLRHRTFSSSSSSSSSSLSTVSSAASSPSPSPSPRGRGTTTTTTSVPFSWEHHPGIPKTRLSSIPAGDTPSSSAPTPLPLPPPLRAPSSSSSRPRHHHHTRRRRAISGKKQPPADHAADPFAAALAECTRERGATGAGPDDDAGLLAALFPSRAPPASSSRRWSSIASAGGVVGLLDLYGCRSAVGRGGVAEGAFLVRRPVAVVRAGPGRAGRR